MAQQQYLDDNGELIKPKAPVYLDEKTGEPITQSNTSQIDNPPIEEPLPNYKSEVNATTDMPSEGWLSKAWHMASDPLWTAPSRMGREIETEVTNPKLNESPAWAMAKGGYGGMMEGAGDLISGLTSPLNLLTAALSGGSSLATKGGYTGAANLLNIGGRIAAAPMAAHGAQEVFSPESTMSQRGMGLAEIAGGILGMRGHVPSGEMPRDLSTPIMESAEVPGYLDRPDLAPVGREDLFNADRRLNNERLPDQQQYDLARNKFNMGQELPSTASDTGVSPQQSLKPGTKVIIKSEKATPEMIKKAQEQGYTFKDLNDKGDFIFEKTGEPTTQPILESEVGTTRPKLGPSVDVKKNNPITEAINLPRALMASVDMSAPLRQGMGLITKPEYWKAFGSMFKAWGSESAFNEIQKSISEKPLFKTREINGEIKPSFAQDAGLQLTDLNDLTKREESIMSTWAEKIPGVRPSNRAYTAFLNKLRADTFESLINDAIKLNEKGKSGGITGNLFTDKVQANPLTDVSAARALADFVNTATGRGSLGKLERAAPILNNTFFAPRLIASRVQMMNPAYYIMANPMVRKEALRSIIAIAGIGNTIGQLAKMGGGEVESNPTSSDYGKIKMGNIRLDPFAGYQQYFVAASRLKPKDMAIGSPTNTGIVPIDNFTGLMGTPGNQTKSSTTGQSYELGSKYGRQTRFDVADRFVESKLTPALSFAMSFLHGKDFKGNQFDTKEELAQRFIPLFLQDLKNLSTNNDKMLSGYKNFHPENLPAAIPAWFGMGTQMYGGPKE